MGNRKEVSRVIRDTVHKVYDGNGAQPQVEESNEKLKFTKQAWDRIGFDLTDRATWDRASASLGNRFNFTPAQMKALDYLANILKTSLETCADATRQIIRVAHTARELLVGYFAKVLKSFGIHVRHDGRVNDYIKALTEMEWLIKLKECWAGNGRARTYVAGIEFYESVKNTSSPRDSEDNTSSLATLIRV